MSMNNIVDILMYVNPETQKIDKMVCFTPFGMTERVGADWEPTSREESGINDLSADRVYLLDWDTDYIPASEVEDDAEHIAVQMFDDGSLDEDGCKKYGELLIDPAQTEDLELLDKLKKLNGEV